jgi:DNA-nicking Smr family endonuclease
MIRRRDLSVEEAALWRKLASTVTPLNPPRAREMERREAEVERPAPGQAAAREQASPPVQLRQPAAAPALRPAEVAKPRPLDRLGLDAGWERRLSRGLVDPDFTLDLHGASLDAAHGRLANGLSQAKAMGARVVLLITGRPRPVESADRGQARGAIRAKVVDWLAAGDHAHDVAAIRGAHRRHGGAGALYIVLRRRK